MSKLNYEPLETVINSRPQLSQRNVRRFKCPVGLVLTEDRPFPFPQVLRRPFHRDQSDPQSTRRRHGRRELRACLHQEDVGGTTTHLGREILVQVQVHGLPRELASLRVYEQRGREAEVSPSSALSDARRCQAHPRRPRTCDALYKGGKTTARARSAKSREQSWSAISAGYEGLSIAF